MLKVANQCCLKVITQRRLEKLYYLIRILDQNYLVVMLKDNIQARLSGSLESLVSQATLKTSLRNKSTK